jgi:Glycosyltransferase
MARPAFKNVKRNPYNFLLYSAIRSAGVEVCEYSTGALLMSHWDVLHVHWPESLLETKSYAAARWSEKKYIFVLDFVRRRGTKLVWTVHDLKPHDLVFPELENRFWTAVLDRLDGLTALTHAGLQLALQRFPALGRLPAFVVPHGHYRDQYPRRVTRQNARDRLGVPEGIPIITYFGQIRPYKNVPRLIECVRAFDDDVRLFVCGRLSKRVDMESALRAAAAGDERVHLMLQFIPDDEVQVYLAAADLLVFPYKDILNSGSALLALSFDRPVLVPNRGAMQELQQAVGPDWVRTYDGDLNEETLRDALVWARTTQRPDQAPLGAFAWDVIARQTINAYASICDAAHSPATGAAFGV